MKSNIETPLVTLALVSYNQEDYIEEAVKNAFAQTYPNLQIILSDDHSTDQTYKIMQKMAREYRGPHCVVLNQNKKNMGIAGHCNYVFALSKGDYIFLAAGDDISDKDRIQTSMQLWMSSDNRYTAIFSNLEKINRDGESLGLMYPTPPKLAKTINDYRAGVSCWVVGASFAFQKSVYSDFGPISDDVRQEDGVLAFRAILMGEIYYLDEPLVKYRFHDNNVSQSIDPVRRIWLQRNAYYMKRARLRDALLLFKNDLKLIRLLRKQCFFSYLQRLFFSMPVLGYYYNYLRIKVKEILR